MISSSQRPHPSPSRPHLRQAEACLRGRQHATLPLREVRQRPQDLLPVRQRRVLGDCRVAGLDGKLSIENPIFGPNSNHKHHQTNSILLKCSKAASDQCKGKPTILAVVSIAMMHELLGFDFGNTADLFRRRPREDPLRHQPLPNRDQAPVPGAQRPSRVGAQDQQHPRRRGGVLGWKQVHFE